MPPNDTRGAIFISGKMWFLLASSGSPVSGNFATCIDSMVLPFGSMDTMVFLFFYGSVVGNAVFTKCILSP